MRSHWASAFGPIAACAYIAGFGIQFKWDVPLIALALFGGLATIVSFQNRSIASSPVILPVLVFMVVTGLSILASEDVGRSMRLSAPLLPAGLLFFIIAERFEGTYGIRVLYLTLSALGLVLSCVLLWVAWGNGGLDPEAWVLNVGSPLLVVKNDVTFLAVVAPLSFVMLYREPRGVVGGLALLSIVLSVCAVCVFQSRVATLTMLASIVFTAALIRGRVALLSGLAILILLAVIDGLTDYSLTTKFIHQWEGSGRIPLWLSAWTMFLDAPIFGHGPHTFVLFYRAYLEGLNLPPWLYVDPRITPWAHNLYLEVLAERGIVGIAALGYLLISGVSAGWSTRHARVAEVRILGAGALGGFVAICFAGVIELSLLRQWVVIMIFILLGVLAQLSYTRTTTQEKI